MHGVYVRNVMQRQVAPELRRIKEAMPAKVYSHMKEHGAHIVLAIDNTSRQLFNRCTSKLEQACIKVVLPYVDRPQQSPSMAMPILFMEGESASDSDGLNDGIACPALCGS
jgi:ribosomal protein L25 (general stress protein Ctc)